MSQPIRGHKHAVRKPFNYTATGEGRNKARGPVVLIDICKTGLTGNVTTNFLASLGLGDLFCIGVLLLRPRVCLYCTGENSYREKSL